LTATLTRAHVCTPPGEPSAEFIKTIQAVRRKLSRWELEHLRKHCAELASQLETAEAQIERLTAERDAAQRDAEAWRDDVNGLVEALEATGQQVGLTQGDAVVAMGSIAASAHQPQTAFDRLEDQLASKLTTLVEPGEGLSIPELLSRFGEAFTPCNGSAMRRALQRTGFKPTRQNYGQRKRVWVAPERTTQGGAS
jgi:hypothetical protein